MKFRCENCGAKFQIADEKIGARGAKVRCRKCSEMIFLSRPETGDASEAAAEEPPTGAAPGVESNGATDGASIDVDLASVDLGALGDEVAKADDGTPATDDGTPATDDEAPATDDEAPATDDEAPATDDVRDPAPSEASSPGPPAEEPVRASSSPPSEEAPGRTESAEIGRIEERNELLEMQASLQAELAGDLGVSAPEPEHDPGRVAVELGSAFRAMFSDEGMASDRAPIEESTPPPPASPERTWFVAIRDEQVGPLSREELEARWNAGEIAPSTLGWRHGLSDWVPVAQIEELGDLPRMKERLVENGRASDDLSYEGLPRIAPHARAETGPVASSADSEGVAWTPSAAQALDSLAEEELADARSEAPTVPAASPFSGLGATSGPPGMGAGFDRPAEVPAASAPPLTPTAPPVSLPPSRSRSWRWAVPLVVLLLGAGAVLAFALTRGLGGGGRSELTRHEPSEGGPGVGTEAPATVAAGVATDAGPAGDASAPADAGPRADAGPAGDAGEGAADAGTAVAASEAEAEKAQPSKPPARVERRAARPEPRPSPARRRPAPRRRGASPTGEEDLLGSHGSGLPEQLSDQEVMRVLLNNKADVLRCVAEQTKADPSLRGQLTVRMTLPGDGRPRRVTVVPAQFRDAPVGQCLIRSVKAWRFPRFSGASIPVDFPVYLRGG